MTGHASFRKDIQGLRAVAVMLVVFYHAGVGFLPGGYVGVDVFFVISGFLITGLLLREVGSTGGINYLQFLARRARRLLPAALVVIAATVWIAFYVFPPLERASTMSAARSAVVYLANIWFAGRAIDYLGGDATGNPMLHMWSLAVEEQFYIIWPWVISYAAAAGMFGGGARHRALCVIASISVLSFAACLWMTSTAQPWAFFGTPFRAWEFGLGAIAFLLGERLTSMPRHVRQALGVFGVLAVLGSATWLNDAARFPGPWAMLPAAGTMLVLLSLAGNAPSTLRTVLSVRPMVRIGDVSYSLYLWHWPLLVMAPIRFPGGGQLVVVGAVLVSYVLAEASYRLVEEPIRRSWAIGWQSKRVLLAAMSVTIAMALALSFLKSSASNQQLSELQKVLVTARDDVPEINRNGCHAGVSTVEPTACESGSRDSRRTVVLFGDSHAAHWYPAFDALAKLQGWRLVSMTKTACPAIDAPVQLDTHRRPYHECSEWRTAAMRHIADMKPDLVVLGNSSRYAKVTANEWELATRRTIDSIATSGAATALIRDTPWPGFGVPVCLARAEYQGANVEQSCMIDRAGGLKLGVAIFHAERRAVDASAGRAKMIDLTAEICPGDRCASLTGGVVHFSDNNHLTATFSRGLVPALQMALQSVPWRTLELP